MSRKNKQNSLIKGKIKEPKNLFVPYFIGIIGFFSFVYSMREYNNFTIISFKFLFFIFLFSGLIISSLFYHIRKREGKINIKLYDFFVLKTFIYGSIVCSSLFLTNNYLSSGKEYIVNSLIFEKNKGIRNSPNSIITEIRGLKREINIHNYSFEELTEFHRIEIKMKNGFWGLQIITDIKLIK